MHGMGQSLEFYSVYTFSKTVQICSLMFDVYVFNAESRQINKYTYLVHSSLLDHYITVLS